MRFAQTRRIDGSREALFELTQNYERRLEWDPFLSDARLIGSPAPAVGTKALCTDRNGVAMEVVYVSYQPPEVAAVKMTRGPFFLDAFAGTWRFNDAGDGHTDVTFKYFYRVKPLFRLVAWYVERIFTRETGARLAALAAFNDGHRGRFGKRQDDIVGARRDPDADHERNADQQS